jgi:hypothetical protein
MKKEKLQKIRDLLEKLYCFDNDFIEDLMEKVELFPEKGVDELINVLEEGKKEQDKMFEKWTEREPDFVKNLMRFVDKTSKSIFQEYEKEEKQSAESILDVLK